MASPRTSQSHQLRYLIFSSAIRGDNRELPAGLSCNSDPADIQETESPAAQERAPMDSLQVWAHVNRPHMFLRREGLGNGLFSQLLVEKNCRIPAENPQAWRETTYPCRS